MPLVLPSPGGARISLSDLAHDRELLDAWLREHRKLWVGMDDKAAAAALLGGLSFEVMQALLASGPDGLRTEWPTASEINLDLAWATWVEGTQSTPVLTYSIEVVRTGRENSPARTQAIADLYRPLVLALAAASGLSARALWRLVTDGVAQACLEAGRLASDLVRGMVLAQEMLGDRASPLFNRQWSFFEVRAHRADGRCVREWFRARGGCCRYYTTPGGTTCSTCVLRDPASRDAILRDWLASRAEAA